MNIGYISRSFVHDYRAAIVPATTICIPIVIETIRLLRQIYEDPTSIKRNIDAFRSLVYFAFHRKEGESDPAFYKRIKTNAAISAIAAFAISGVVCTSFLALPAATAIPAALSAAFALGNLFYKLGQNPVSIKKIKNYLVEAFKQREQETIQEFHLRRWDAIRKVLLYSSVFCICVGAVAIAPSILQTISQVSDVWQVAGFIPFQTPEVVFAEYALLGVLHLIQAIRYWNKSEHTNSIFHLASSLAAIFFPLWYAFAPGNEMRLHHSFTGLLLQLAPFQTVRIFGTFIAADSGLYFFSSQRGYISNKNRLINYDYLNAVYEQFPLAILGLTAISLFEIVVSHLTRPAQIGARLSKDANEL